MWAWATTTLIAQAAGRKDQVRAELVFHQSFVMSIVIAFALGIVGFLLRPAYCDWLSAMQHGDVGKSYSSGFCLGFYCSSLSCAGFGPALPGSSSRLSDSSAERAA